MVEPLGAVVVALSFCAVVSSLALAWYLSRFWGAGGASWLVGTIVAQAFWALAYGVGLLVGEPELRRGFEAAAFAGMSALGPFFLGFALEYTGRLTVDRKGLLPALLLSPLATAVLAVTHPFHGLLWTGFRVESTLGLAVASYTIEPLGYLVIILSLAMAGVGVLLLVETVLSYGPLYRREALAVAVSTLSPAVPVMVWLAGVGPWPALNLGPALLVGHVALDTYAFVGTHMFESNPTTQRAAERSALDDLAEPLLVLDGENRVVKVNTAASQLFGVSREGLPCPFERVTGTALAPAREEGTLRTDADRNATYALSYTPLADGRGSNVGSIVVLYEVSDERRRKRQLSVLNRVLRHNLRNEMMLVKGYADAIDSHSTDPEITEEVMTIMAASDRVLSIAENVREFERIQEKSRTFSVVDVTEPLREAWDSVAVDHPEAVLEVTVEDDAWRLRTDPEVLTLATQNLLENAVVHAPDGDTSRVWLDVRGSADGDAVTITVQDENEPIPEMEISTLEAPEESSLQHGNGVGLWIVGWCETALDGELAFDYDDGNAVRLTLPTAAGDRTAE